MGKRSRRGFSLIELLIVVAIIAALVGVAVPFFQDNLKDAQQAKAKEDMDTIRNAIAIHDAQNRPLTGTSLRPLLGRYLQDLPRDPWGNEYLFDAAVGVVLTYGADAMSGGSSTDQDIPVRYKPALRIQRAQYEGSWGPPKSGNKLYVTLTKPYDWRGNAVGTGGPDFTDSVQLLTAARDPDPITSTGNPCSFSNNGYVTAVNPLDAAAAAQTWAILDSTGNQRSGLVNLQCTIGAPTAPQLWTATMAINFDDTAPVVADTYAGVATRPVRFGITERFYQYGPLDPAVYGPDCCGNFLIPEAIDLVDGDNRGVKIERY